MVYCEYAPQGQTLLKVLPGGPTLPLYCRAAYYVEFVGNGKLVTVL